MMKKLLFLGALACAFSQINAQTTVFNETFEMDSPTLAGWDILDNDGDQESWQLINDTNSTNGWGFSGLIVGSVSYNKSPDNILVSPAISLPTTGTLSLSYQVACVAMLPAEHYSVYVLPASVTFTGTETPIFTETLTAAQGQTATLRTVNLSSFAGQNVKMYFRHFNSNNQYLLAMDNVKVTQTTATLGTNEVVDHGNINIYPNPTTDYLYIKSKSKVSNVEVYDMAGRKMDVVTNADKINVMRLQAGNYILTMETKEGLISQKFIKK